ncbi:MAG: glutamate--tRNA ligase [Bacteroidia bacterium]|nr:glutamate--tRNA ligase [Bacteroidia bacterium]MBT8275569.1 glutamate--tRNA ligase [Bacteroidia bacterium]NNF31494.1 glutamate--tRNA ligase [Flavobacteriaceae bacterium]NNK54073.1 glutamate--tRNA ligase [Flavobacteriaceae bacterium]NNM07650.1 glutamate--tRNA ligase [Flavobacteriaceae bacterium]
MAQKVRVRFAPSPTGPLHIGGVRTALFNYLFAKKNQGDFILRIEDTDRNRYVEGTEDYIIESLNWLNIPFDEGPGKEGNYGPYRQSEREHLYKEYADLLISEGKAYYAFDTAEELAKHRKDHEAEGKTFIYNWHNREKLNNALVLNSEETQKKLDAGDPYVIRFKSPQDTAITLTDIIRGEISIDSNTLDDKVLFKSDGMPTYHLANIVDDHLMEISHVIRGEEWLPSLALHQMLYDAFGWSAPEFAHLPLIMKPVGKGKLSKRDGEKLGFPVFPLEWKPENAAPSAGYREEGYLPEAVVNMLALLGWNPGTEQEIFSLEELVSAFDLGRVHKGGAKFDPEKTRWFQHHYLQMMDESILVSQFNQLLSTKGISDTSISANIVPLLKERATFVEDLWEQGSFFYEAPRNYDEKASMKAFKEDTKEILSKALGLMQNVDTFSAENISESIKGWITSNQIGFGKVMMPLRLALVGEMKGPDVFKIAALLGQEEVINRIQAAINFID